jgi:hypothetical protein
MTPSANFVRESGGPNTDAFAYLNGIQVTESESHTKWKESNKGHFRGDSGGPFHSTKRTCSPVGFTAMVHEVVDHPLWFYPEWTVTDRWTYNGPYAPLSPNLMEYPPSAESSPEELDRLGATAIARCSPSNPSADLTVTLGEFFTEGIPSIIGGTLKTWRNMTTKDRRRSIGDEYLNVEFGWKPLMNDLKKISSSLLRANLIMNQYFANSGKMVRRRYNFPTVNHAEALPSYSNTSPWVSPSVNALTVPSQINLGRVSLLYEVQKRQWFSGAFTYYVPPADNLRNSVARYVIQARHLLGLSLTPDTVWNLAPWSWAVDWFFNVGDVLQNWTNWAIDNQVLLYGYMMEHTISTYTYTFSGPSGYVSGDTPTPVTLSTESKVRRQATPYGFGFSWDSFSPRQLAIIAALGISRS